MQKKLLQSEIRLLKESAKKAKGAHFEQLIRTIAAKEEQLERTSD